MKRKYMKPGIEVEFVETTNLLEVSLGIGNGDGGNNAESKRNVFFAINDPDGYEGKWGDIWSDETEEY